MVTFVFFCKTLKFNKTMETKSNNNVKGNGIAGTMYLMAFIGALIHYWQHVSGIGGWVLGCLKAAVWPAMVTYNLMEYLKM